MSQPSPSRMFGLRKQKNPELNSYQLLSNLCIMSWQQRSFQYHTQGSCCHLITMERLRELHNATMRSRRDLSVLFVTGEVKMTEQHCQ